MTVATGVVDVDGHLMPTAPPAIVRPARAIAEARKQRQKIAREHDRQQRVVVDDACREALRRAALPRHEQLRAALGTVWNAERLCGVLRPFREAISGLQHSDTAAAYAAVVDVVCAVEAHAPGLLLVEVGEHGRLGRAIVRLAGYADRFVRPLSTWQPPRRQPDRVWRSLVQHTVQRFAMPAAWNVAFIDDVCDDAIVDAVVAVGNGHSWRTVPLPTFVSRAVAHALGTVDVVSASATSLIRDAQARALGLSPAHRGVVCSHEGLDDFLHDEDGVEAVFAFLARHPQIAADDVKLVCEAIAGCEGSLPSMKGRTDRSLIALCIEMIGDAKQRAAGRLDVGAFLPSTIAGGDYVLRDDKSYEQPTFLIAPIGNGSELVEEGIAMRHCVGTYAERARRGEVIIFGVGVAVGGSPAKRALTIEVRPATRSIIQVRGKGNRQPSDIERGIVRCWAQEQGLQGAP